MKSIFLINPCYDKKEKLKFFEKYITSQLPLGIGFLAGYLISKGVKVAIRDEQLGQLDEETLGRIIEENEIRVVGISVMTLTASRAYELSGMIRAKRPDITIIMGGVHPTILPEEPLLKGAADMVVRNEGELTLLELIDKIHDGRPYYDTAGISFRKDGLVLHNPARELIANLDDLPSFPFHLFEDDIRRYQFGNMLTSRGCPYECIFCSQRSISGKRYRTRSPEKIVEELETLVYKYKQDYIYFNDDNFIVNKKHCYELCDLIEKKGFPAKLKLGINARGDIMDMELLRRLRKAGFYVINFGLETGSARVMKLIKKGETVGDISRAVRLAKRAGFITSGQFILGFPTETREESLMTVRLAFNLPLDFTRFNLLVPYPGTEVFDIINKTRSKIYNEKDWSNLATHSALTRETIPYIPEGRTAGELVDLQWKASLRFYLRPWQIFNFQKLRYAMANQVVLPSPYSLKGMLELAEFIFNLMVYSLRTVVRIPA